MLVFEIFMEPYFLFLVAAHFLGPVAKNISRRLTCPSGATITYLPAAQFIGCVPYIYLFHQCALFLQVCTPLISFLSDARYVGMTMLMVPLSVLASICFNPCTTVLGVLKVPLNHVRRMWVEGRTQRCRVYCRPITPTSINTKKNFMDHVLKHVSLSVRMYRVHCSSLQEQKTNRRPYMFQLPT